MATENITVNGTWQAAHTATANNTNVVLTPRGSDVEWVINTTTPSASLQGHMLSEPLDRGRGFKDRGFVLANGEILYVRGPRDVVVARTVAS